MKKGIVAGLVLLLGISSAQARSVFGDRDPRVAMTSSDYPWRTIGKIYPSGCTASLVWHNLVVTAAHCVIEKGTNKRVPASSMSFRPFVVKGQSYDMSRVEEVYTTSTVHHPTDYSVDWAVLRLEKSLGVQYGYLGFASAGPYEPNIPVDLPMTLVGYGSDFMGGNTAGVHQGCKIWGKHPRYNYLLHDCATTPGVSGGPVMTEGSAFKLPGWVIVAVNNAEHVQTSPNPNCEQGYDANGNMTRDSEGYLTGKDKNGNTCQMEFRKGYRGGEYRDEIANIACPVDHFMGLIANLRDKYPWPKEEGSNQTPDQQMLGK